MILNNIYKLYNVNKLYKVIDIYLYKLYNVYIVNNIFKLCQERGVKFGNNHLFACNRDLAYERTALKEDSERSGN